MSEHDARETQKLEDLTRQMEDAVTDETIMAYLRFILVRNHEGKWVLCFGRIDLCREDDMKEGPRYEYPAAKTLASKLSGRVFLGQFKSLFSTNQPFVVDGMSIGPLDGGRWEFREFKSSNDNDYASWPCLHAALQMDSHAIDSARGPFASARGFPYFDSAYELVRDVGQFRAFYFGQDDRRRNLHLVVWRYRGRFSSFNFQDGKLQIDVEGRFLDQLQVSGRVSGYGWEHQFNYPAQSRFELQIRGQPRRIEAALVARDDEIIDLMRNDFNILGQHKKEQPIAETVDWCLHQGESVTIEYKPFVNLKEDGEWKRDEIVRTALAMANTQGGYILLGVDNQGIPNFLKKGVADPTAWKAIIGYTKKDEKKGTKLAMPSGVEEIEEGVLRYGAELRDEVQKRSNRTLLISVNMHFKDSSAILVLRIEPGDEKPYMDVRDHSVWFRANATNRRPNEAELESLFRGEKDRYDEL